MELNPADVRLMSEFRRAFRVASDNLAGGLAAAEVDQYVGRVEEEIDILVAQMRQLAVNQKGLHYAKGDVAEAWHAGTFRVDAARRGVDANSFTPRDTSPVDIEVHRDGIRETAQLKFYRTAEDSARAISHPKYAEMDQKVVPSDQLEGVREAAARLSTRNLESRPDVAASYGHTRDTVDDRLRHGEVASKPLSERDAREIVKDLRNDGDVNREALGIDISQIIEWNDILREATTAAARAAILSAALQAAPHLIAIGRKALDTGELTLADFKPLASEVPTALLRSSIAGGLSSAMLGAARQGAFGAVAKSASPAVIAAGVTLAMSAFDSSLAAARGELAWTSAAARIAQDGLMLAAASGGALVGQMLIPIPILGAILGNMAGAAVARLSVDKASGAVLGLAAETGWTVFGLVDQNHTVPEHVLADGGWELLDIERFQPERFTYERFQPTPLEVETLDVHVLRRGVLAFGRVAYL